MYLNCKRLTTRIICMYNRPDVLNTNELLKEVLFLIALLNVVNITVQCMKFRIFLFQITL